MRREDTALLEAHGSHGGDRSSCLGHSGGSNKFGKICQSRSFYVANGKDGVQNFYVRVFSRALAQCVVWGLGSCASSKGSFILATFTKKLFYYGESHLS